MKLLLSADGFAECEEVAHAGYEITQAENYRLRVPRMSSMRRWLYNDFIDNRCNAALHAPYDLFDKNGWFQ